MKRARLLFALFLLVLAPHGADAQDDAPRAPADPVELVCLDRLDVGPIAGIARDVAARATVHADTTTNCFVVIGPATEAARLRQLTRALEQRAEVRRPVAPPRRKDAPSSARRSGP